MMITFLFIYKYLSNIY